MFVVKCQCLKYIPFLWKKPVKVSCRWADKLNRTNKTFITLMLYNKNSLDFKTTLKSKLLQVIYKYLIFLFLTLFKPMTMFSIKYDIWNSVYTLKNKHHTQKWKHQKIKPDKIRPPNERQDDLLCFSVISLKIETSFPTYPTIFF